MCGEFSVAYKYLYRIDFPDQGEKTQYIIIV